MRRSDREVTALDDQLDIIRRCDTCRLAFYDPEAPYIVPMNFGFAWTNNTLVLYFHCAKSGEKLERMAAHPQVGFEMDCAHRLVTAELACDYTMEYESVIGRGIAERIDDDRKEQALACIMRHYRPNQPFSFDTRMVDAVTVFQVTVTSFTAKRLRK